MQNQVVTDNFGMGTRVWAIAWHVDYWDYLGWPDPYAQAEHTDRQIAYAKANSHQNLFTPHMLVAGKTISGGAVGGAIQGALQQAATTSVTIWRDPNSVPGSEIHIGFSVRDAPMNSELHLVVVERGLVHEIGGGENHGKILNHDAPARWWRKLPPAVSGTIQVVLPEAAVFDNCSMVAFVQDPSTMQLSGATGLDTLRAPQ